MLEENETVKNYLYLAANDDAKTKESEFCTYYSPGIVAKD